MTDSSNKAEFITVLLNNNTSNDHVRIILAYSPREKKIHGVTDFYQNLSVQIERAHSNGDNVILVGDFNAKLGSEIIAGDLHPMSSSGKLLNEFYTKYNLHLLNSSDVCAGVLTRIQHYNGKIEKSTIDYMFVSSGLVSCVISVQINEEKVITPWRIVRSGQKKFTDHCAVKVDLNLEALTHKQTSRQRVKLWNFNNEKGWEKFRELTRVPTSFKNYVWKNGDHPEICYQRWRGGLDSILRKCFKKKTLETLVNQSTTSKSGI